VKRRGWIRIVVAVILGLVISEQRLTVPEGPEQNQQIVLSVVALGAILWLLYAGLEDIGRADKL
jgi:hypothetical protein